MTKAYLIIAVYACTIGYISYVIGFWCGVRWYKRLRDKTDAAIKEIQQQASAERDASDWWKKN